MTEYVINDKKWNYISSKDNAGALILPSGRAYLLPAGFSLSIFNADIADALTASHRYKASSGYFKNKSKTFNCEQAVQGVFNHVFSDDTAVNDRIPFRTLQKKSDFVFDDVAVPVSRYRKPFDSLGCLLAYLASVYPARTLPEWAVKGIETGEHLNCE